jgi:phage tail-like protein
MARQDPLRKFRFRLEIDGLEQAAFSEVTIGDLASDPIEYREGDEARLTVRKLSGLTKYANVTLKWGITDSLELADWHQLVVGGATLLDDIRKTVVIRVQNEAGEDKAAFEVTRAWPSKYDPTDLNGTGNEGAIDSLELANEGIRRIQ